MAGDGLDLTVGATRFQEIDGGVLTQAMKGVFEFVTVQLKAFTLALPILVESILAKGLASRGAGETVRPDQGFDLWDMFCDNLRRFLSANDGFRVFTGCGG